MSPVQLAAGVVIGVVTGILSGLLGIGGGVVMVPAMVLAMGVSQQTAQGTSLLVIVPTAVSGALTHYRHGLLRGRLPLWLGAMGMLAAAAGSLVALNLNPARLRQVFAVYLIFIGVRSVVSRSRPAPQPPAVEEAP